MYQAHPNLSLSFLICLLLLMFFNQNIHAQNVSVLQNDNTAELRWVDSVFASLSNEERIAQLMVVRANQPGKEYDVRIDSWISKYNIGGITFFKGKPVTQLIQTNRWQQLAKTPLLISIDAEWGLAMRLDNTVQYPMQMTLGAIDSNQLIMQMGRQIADQCKRMGIHMNFAPVIDVNNNPANPVIGMRAFGEEPLKVAEKGWLYAQALQENGIIATAKHFPGHGDTHTDSHYTLPVINHPAEHLENNELLPFQHLIDQGLAGIMIAHLYMPAFEKQDSVATSLSYNVVHKLLKEKMNFKGLIVTDALDMKGVTDYHPAGTIDLMALMAGNDILLLPENLPLAIQSIAKAAVENQEVANRIEESCRKVLTYKYRVGLNNYRPSFIENLDKDLNQRDNYELALTLYTEAMTLLKNDDGMIPFINQKEKRVASLAIGVKTPTHFQKSLINKGLKADLFTLPKSATKEQIDKINLDLSAYDQIIVSIQNTNILANKKFGIEQQGIDFVDRLTKKKDVALIVFASPYAADYFAVHIGLKSLMIAYQDNKLAEEAAAGILIGSNPAKGKLPVSAGMNWPSGAGLITLMESPTEAETIVETLTTEIQKKKSVIQLNEKALKSIDSIAMDGIMRKAYPGCQIVALKDGEVIYDKCFGFHTYDNLQQVKPTDLYDVASLTKILASTLAIMKLTEDGKLNLNDPLVKYFPYLTGSAIANITFIEILTHQSGLTDWIPFYTETIKNHTLDTSVYSKTMNDMHPFRVADSLYIRRDYKNHIFETISKSKLKKKEYRYSDLGFYFFPELVEMITNTPFDLYLEKTFYGPLNLKRTLFQPQNRFSRAEIIPTEKDMEFRHQLLHGDVHDQGAAMLGGISGHAGLFSNAYEVAMLMQLLIDRGSCDTLVLLKPESVDKFTSVQFPKNDNRRGLGFDKPPLDTLTKSRIPSKLVSKSSFGHSGFTGTFAWADPENKLVFVFLSNRVHPDTKVNRLSQLSIRTKLHDLFYQAVQ
jgi:beta-N-acetylhexosaminidase